MSEFECANGHLMKSGDITCPKCGARLARMDGMSEKELRAQESADLAAGDREEESEEVEE